ncbi:MAG: hypothetical protein MJ252_30360 [archaeon]|nr:hypothetical protein [archaeon]
MESNNYYSNDLIDVQGKKYTEIKNRNRKDIKALKKIKEKEDIISKKNEVKEQIPAKKGKQSISSKKKKEYHLPKKFQFKEFSPSSEKIKPKSSKLPKKFQFMISTKAKKKLNEKYSPKDNIIIEEEYNIPTTTSNSSSIPILYNLVMKKKKEVNLSYNMALIAYKGNGISFFTSFFDNLKQRELFFRIFSKRNKYELFALNVMLYLYFLGGSFCLNAFFYTDSVIEEKYENNGHISLLTYLARSLYTSLCSVIVITIGKSLYNYMPKIDVVLAEVKQKKYLIGFAVKLIKMAKKKIAIYISVTSIMILFFIYYITVFCAVYHGCQESWFIGGCLSIAISLGINIGISLFLVIFRVISLKCECMYLYNLYLLAKGLLL